MKKGWKTEPLGALCDIRNGSTPSKGNPTFWDGGTIPWFTIDDMREQGREISSTRQKITKSALSETSVKLLPEDSVLLCCTASVGEFAITRIPLTTNQQFNGLVVKNRNQLDPNFLFHYVSTLKDELLGLSGKTTIDFIPISRLRDVAVPVPPLAEQQRIVGLLDEAFEGLATAKANAEKNLQNARALFESHLQSVFTQRGPGWAEKPFEDCIEDVKYTTKIQRKEFLEEGEFPIVSQEAEFTNGYWDNAADVFKVTRPIVVFGDHTQVLKYIDFDFVLGADGVKLLPPKPFLNPKFFFYALRSAPLKSLGYARHYRLLKELQIGYPDMNTQVAIAKKLDALTEETQRLARLYERKHAALEALKKSLLHQAFTGEL